MGTSVPLLLVAAAGVGIAHSALPDHWLPLAVVARGNRWTLARTAKISLLASFGHVGVSVVLGLGLALAGLPFRGDFVAQQGHIIGGLLVLTGLGFLLWGLREQGHGRHHEHGGTPPPGGPSSRRARISRSGEAPRRRCATWLGEVAVPFGVAASPDLTVLPVFLAASAVGMGAAVGSLLAFALATVLTFVVLTVGATAAGRQVHWPWVEDNGHVISALVLLIIGALVYVGL